MPYHDFLAKDVEFWAGNAAHQTRLSDAATITKFDRTAAVPTTPILRVRRFIPLSVYSGECLSRQDISLCQVDAVILYFHDLRLQLGPFVAPELIE